VVIVARIILREPLGNLRNIMQTLHLRVKHM